MSVLLFFFFFLSMKNVFLDEPTENLTSRTTDRMGKRKSSDKGGNKNKKFKAGGFLDPNTSGIYATCARGKEQQCRKELMNIFSDKIEQLYDLDQYKDEQSDEEDKELSIEDQIKKELNDMKQTNESKKEFLKPIEIGCECVVFIKTRKPVQPEELVEKICKDCVESKEKTTRYTLKLTPITYSVSPTIEEVKKLAAKVLAPHFHKPEGQEPVKFAIQVSKRNFNTLERGDIIKTIAECVGREHGHSVDLKKYDKLILVECFKTNIGMGVASNYEKFEKYNLQQIFEKNMGEDDLSRVKKEEKDSKEEQKEDANAKKE